MQCLRLFSFLLWLCQNLALIFSTSTSGLWMPRNSWISIWWNIFYQIDCWHRCQNCSTENQWCGNDEDKRKSTTLDIIHLWIVKKIVFRIEWNILWVTQFVFSFISLLFGLDASCCAIFYLLLLVTDGPDTIYNMYSRQLDGQSLEVAVHSMCTHSKIHMCTYMRWHR